MKTQLKYDHEGAPVKFFAVVFMENVNTFALDHILNLFANDVVSGSLFVVN